MKRRFRRPLVVGSTGQLGHDLLEVFSDNGATGLSHDQIAIEDRASVDSALQSHEPDLVLNTAAFHNVPSCENHQREAFLVNAVGVANLAQACARRNIIFATVSSDYVFDGTKGSPYNETDEPHPLSAYGLSKLAGELLASSTLPQHFIFRTSGLFGKLGSKSKGYTFIDRILQQARDGAPISVVTDLTFSPSYTKHVAAAMRAIVERAPYGIYHVTNTGSCTWYDFAVYSIGAAGLSADVTPVTSDQWRDGVKRPTNSALGPDAMVRSGLPEPPPWRDAVREFLKDRASE